MANIDQFKSLISRKGGIARTSAFRVKLPSIPGATSEEVNLLCKDAQLPGRQIMTNERQIGLKHEKIAYGYAVDDVSLTFYVMNDYGIKQYFEQWQNLAVDQSTYEIGYQRGQGGYAFDVEIEQLKKGISLPVYSTPIGLPRLPTIIQNRLPKLGPFDLAQGQLDIDFVTPDQISYSCKLINAFPTSMTAIQLNNEMDGLVELNVTLSYTNWKSNHTPTPTAQNDFVNTLIGTGLTRLSN